MKSLIVLSALVLLAVGCGQEPAAPRDSGVEGVAMVDGGCPPARDAPPCPDKPLSARITVTRAGSDEDVVVVDSGEDGRFRIALAPGDYTLRPANLAGTPLPIAQPIDVHVVANRFSTVEVSFDSGVRDAPSPQDRPVHGVVRFRSR
ncbi:hypothetical protein ACSHWB_35040 [Lentzea sp. HUAS TT2]|uniref:hypothetical protein n=1 Tax=Lentzea sp. HUAS TT2 TaxID=3447454 RepID=UPI003F72F578